MTTRLVWPAVGAAVLLAGCGIPNPNAQTTPRRQTVPPAAPLPRTAPAAPSALHAPAGVARARRDPLVDVAVEYVLRQATWSADTYVAQQARLARLATGRALAQLAPRDGQPPASVAATLKAAGSSSHAFLVGTDGPSPGRHRVVVAYKTHATGTGRHPGRPDYQIAHVTLTRRHGRWLVSRFAIQP
jgi:hypothetical protein